MAEFRALLEKLQTLQEALHVASSGINLAGSDDEPLRALRSAHDMLSDMGPRAEVFERRAKEADPDRKIYGPQMTQRVLAFCDGLARATEDALELEEALAPLQERVDSATREAERQAKVERGEEARRAAAEQQEREEHAAIVEAQLAEVEAQAAAANSVRLVQQEDASLGRRPLSTGLSLGGALSHLESSCSVEVRPWLVLLRSQLYLWI